MFAVRNEVPSYDLREKDTPTYQDSFQNPLYDQQSATQESRFSNPIFRPNAVLKKKKNFFFYFRMLY